MKKKPLSLLLFVFLLSFTWLFATEVKAEALEGTKIVQNTISYRFRLVGESHFYRYRGKRNLVCPTQTPNGSARIEMIEEEKEGGVSTGYSIVKTTYTNSPSTNQGPLNDPFDCTYVDHGKTYVLRFDYTFEPQEITSEATITLRGRLSDNAIDSNSKLDELYYMDEIVSSKVTSAGTYVNLNCPAGGKSCIVTGNFTDEEDKEETLEIQFKRAATPGVVYTIKVKVLVNYKGSARAFPGSYTCNFDSNWRSFYSESNPDINDGKRVSFYYALTNDVVFPTCSDTVKDNLPIKFVGWSTSSNKVDPQKLNYCRNHGLIPAGSGSVHVGKAYNYYSCFEYEPFVGLNTALGTLSGTGAGNWTAFSGKGMDYFQSTQGEVALPSVTYDSANYTFGGWHCNSISGVLKEGDKVKAGTSCTAIKNNNYSYVSLNKTVYVDKKLIIAVSDRKITSCSTTGSNVKVEVKDNTCVVTGLSVSESPNDVTVNFEKVEGKDDSRTYKVTVEKIEDAQFDFIISAPIAGVPTHGDGNGIVYSGSSCGSFVATGAYSHDSADGVDESIYQIKTNCGDNASYASICLDPDRHGPQNGDAYEKSENVRSDTPMGLVLQAIISEISKNPSLASAFSSVHVHGELLEFRVAAQVAVRVVGIASGTYVQSPDVQGFDGNEYARYERAANAFMDKNTSVESALDYVYTSRGNSFNYAVAMLKYVRNQGKDDTPVGVEREIDTGYPQVTDVGDNSYKLKYKGTLKVPKSMKLTAIHKCGSNSLGIKCYSASLGAAVAGDKYDTYEYEVEIGTDDALHMQIPISTGDKMSIAFEIEATGTTLGDSFVISPTGGGKNGTAKQRMVVFSYTQGAIYMYFSPIPPECLTELTALKFANAENPSSFNQALFKAAKCCNLVANESIPNYSYLINNVCNSECTTSTMEPVCNYASLAVDVDENGLATNFGKSDLYQIHEGAHYGEHGWELNLSSAPDGGGACVVNVIETKGNYYSSSGGWVHLKNKDAFVTKDDLGNNRNVAEYANNKFCQVTCKEDFDLTMGAYGNYMGQNAIQAGSHFTMDDTKIFMYGSMSCYTTYVNYKDYMDGQAQLSYQIVSQYDTYASWNHAATDLMDYVKGQYQAVKNDVIVKHNYTVCGDYTWNGCATTTQKRLCPKDENGKRPSKCDDLTTEEKDLVTFCTSGIWECNEVNMSVPDALNYWGRGKSKMYNDPQYPGPGEYQEFETTPASGTASMSVSDHAANFADASSSFPCTAHNTSDISVYTGEQEDSWGQPDDSPNAFVGGKRGYVSCDYNSKIYPNDVNSEGIEYIQQQAFSMHSDMDLERAGDTSDAAGKAVNALSSEMHENARQFYYCQHFGVYTQRIGDAGAAAAAASDSGSGVDRAGGSKVAPKVIGVDFNPTAYYSYDEKQYMVTVGDDNYLVRDDEANQTISGNENFGKTSEDIAADAGEAPLADNGSYKRILYNNHVEARYCNVDTPWVPSSQEGKTYGQDSGNCSTSVPPTQTRYRVMCMAGHMVSEGTWADGKDGPYFVPSGHQHWVDGKCFTVGFEYKEANYIMKSVMNSSFYVNKGFWWNGPGNVRIHGDYISEKYRGAKDDYRQAMQGIYGYGYTAALDKYSSTYNVTFGDDAVWSMVGNYYNTFPISMTTARGLYAYTYQFANIGTYFGQATLGRLMGNPESVVAVNSRTCFYEVWEELCGCCGDPIEFHTAVLEGSASDTITEQVRDDNSSLFPTGDKISSSYDNGQANANLNFFSTVSSLSDLSAITDTGATRKLASNWGESFFSYGSNQYLITHKGEAAKNAIEMNSEVVYTKTPEYSFTLTPTKIQEIRAYNKSKDSYVNKGSEDLVNLGTYTMVPTSNCTNPKNCSWTEAVGSETTLTVDNTNFTHYGSAFLNSSFMLEAATPETVARLSNNTICDNLNTNVNDYDATLNCRFVDYIETNPYSSSSGSVSSRIDAVCPNGQRYDMNSSSCLSANYYRLAFK